MRSSFLWGILAATLILVAVLGARSLLPGAGGPAMEDFGAVPDFALTGRDGRVVTGDDLAGSFWVADFIFTRCQGMCPLLRQRMAALDRRLPPGARLVSISVDPDFDTPEVLTRYAREVAGGADIGRWLFLTGSVEQISTLLSQGFHVAVAQREGDAADPGELITHSDRFVLVDPQGHIRGYYHGLDEETVDRIASDLERLSTSTFSRR